MLEHPFTKDPEVVSLLEEAASRPDSRLFRSPATPEETRDPLSPVSSDAAAVERHLALVHRERAAELLVEAARWSVENSPESVLFSRARTRPIMTEAELRRSCAAATRREAGRELTSRIAEGGLREISAARLATAASNLFPTAYVRYNLARALTASRKPGAARAVYEGLLSGPAAEIGVELANWGVAACFAMEGDSALATEHYRKTIELGADSPELRLSVLFHALLQPDMTTARIAIALARGVTPTEFAAYMSDVKERSKLKLGVPRSRLNEDALSELDEGLRVELMTVIPRVVL